MEHLSLSRSFQHQGSKVTCSVWEAEKVYTPHKVNNGCGITMHFSEDTVCVTNFELQ